MRCCVINIKTDFIEASNNEICECAGGTFTNQQTVIAFWTCGITHERGVIDRRSGTRCRFVIFTAIINFKTVIGIITILLDYEELRFTRPTVRPVEGVIPCACNNDVFQVDSTAEHFNAVVLVHVDLDVLNDRTRPNALEGDAVEFVVRAEFDTCVFNADVAKDAAAIGWVVSAERTRIPFTERYALVRRGVPVDNQTAPLPTGTASDRCITRHNDGVTDCPLCHNFRTLGDDECAVGRLLTKNLDTRLDG